MTTYGTIPTSYTAAARLEYISRANEMIKAGIGSRRPWREMFNIRSIGFPSSFRDAVSRIKTNLSYFRMNYAMVVLVILFLSLLWHPISLIVFFALMAAWLFFYFLRDEPLVIFGRTVNDRVVLIVLAVLTVALLLLTKATANILISLLVAIVIVLIHSALRKTDDLFFDQEDSGGLLARHGPAVPSS